MFDHGRVTLTPLRDDGDAVVQQLRERMHRMTDGVPRLPVVMPPELAGLVQLRTGGSYRVDDVCLALALLAAPSREGAWVGVVGVNDLGVEAAGEAGVDLARTVVVPDPGEHWLEVTAALVDVLPVVLLRPPAAVRERTTSRIAARLRKRSSILLVLGDWPGCEARLWLTASEWYGAGHGHGRLASRQVKVSCRRGSAPPRETMLWLPAAQAPLQPGSVQRVEEKVAQTDGARHIG